MILSEKQNREWLHEVTAVKEVSIKRHYGWEYGSQRHLHVFADASEMLICVVAHMRIETVGSVFQLSLKQWYLQLKLLQFPNSMLNEQK